MEDAISEEIEKINQMTRQEMASLWMFAKFGHPYFDRTKPFWKVFEERFDSLGGMTPGLSKSIG